MPTLLNDTHALCTFSSDCLEIEMSSLDLEWIIVPQRLVVDWTRTVCAYKVSFCTKLPSLLPIGSFPTLFILSTGLFSQDKAVRAHIPSVTGKMIGFGVQTNANAFELVAKTGEVVLLLSRWLLTYGLYMTRESWVLGSCADFRGPL